MSDEHPTAPLPDPGARWVLATDAGAPAPRRRWPWVVTLLVVGVLAAAAWFVGEYVARGIVERTIREQVTRELGLPADQQIDIGIPGPIIPQLIVGSFAELTIASDDVSLGGLNADVRVDAMDVPTRGGGDWSGGYATVSFDEAQLQTLLSQVEGFPAETVSLDAPDVAADFELQVLGIAVPVGVSLAPRAEGGDLVLSPAAFRVAGTEITADALRDQFGLLASPILGDWDVCFADRVPQAVELTDVEVRREAVVARFEIDSAIIRDPAAQAMGTCA